MVKKKEKTASSNSTANMPALTLTPQEKELADSLSRQQNLERQLTSVKKLYAQLLTQVRDEDPERFKAALQEKLEEIVEDSKQGHPFEQGFHEVLLRFAVRATEARHQQLDAGHKRYIEDLDNQHRARIQELEEFHEKNTQELEDELNGSLKVQLEARVKELEDKYQAKFEKEVQTRVDLAFDKKYKEDVQNAANQIEARVTAVCQRDFDIQNAKNLAEIDGRVQARADQIRNAIEIDAQEKINKLEAKGTIEVEQRVQERLAGVQKEIEARYITETQAKISEIRTSLRASAQEKINRPESKYCAGAESRIQARVVEIQASLDAGNQKKIDDLEAKSARELETQVQARTSEIQTSLKSKSASQLDQRVEAIVAQLRSSIEADAQQKITDIESRATAQFEARVLEIQRSIEDKFATEVEERVEVRVAEICASVEAKAQLKIAEAESKSAEDLAKLEIRTTTMADELDELQQRLTHVIRERNTALDELDEARKNFEALEKQITQQEEEVEAEKAKTKAVQDKLDTLQVQSDKDNDHITELEQKRFEAESKSDTLEEQAKKHAEDLSRLKIAKEAAEANAKKLREDGVNENITLRALRAENGNLKTQITAKDTTIKENAAELERIPVLEEDNNKIKKLYAQMVDQLMLLRKDMEKNKFNLAPDAYDDPRGPGAFTSVGVELADEIGSRHGSENGSEVGSQYSASAPGSDAGSDSDSSDEDEEDAKGGAARRSSSTANIQPPVFIPATTSSHNPLMCWLSTERHAIVMGGAVVNKSTDFLRRSWLITNKVPMSPPDTPTSPSPTQANRSPPPSPPGSPQRFHRANPTPPMTFGVFEEAQGSPPASPRSNTGVTQSYHFSSAPTDENGPGNNENPTVSVNSEPTPSELLAMMARSSASATIPKSLPSDPNNSASDISASLPDLSSDEEEEHVQDLIPLGSSTLATSTNSDTISMNTATASGNGEGPPSTASGSGIESRVQRQKTVDEGAAENLDSLSEDEDHGRVPSPRGSRPFGISSKYVPKLKPKYKGKSKDTGTENDDNSSTASRSSKSSKSKPKPSSLSSDPPNTHSHSAFSVPYPSPTIWDEMRTPRDLNTWDSYRTLIFLAIHILIYFMIWAVIDTYILGNQWIAANENTRAAVQSALRANRGGQGQTWPHFWFSEGVAQNIDWFAWAAMGGGEPVAYPMPG